MSFIRRWHCQCDDCPADGRDYGLWSPYRERLIKQIKNSDWYMEDRETVYCPDCKGEHMEEGEDV